jgi:hypothetical protein
MTWVRCGLCGWEAGKGRDGGSHLKSPDVKDNDLAKTVLGKAPAKKNIQEGGRRLWHTEEQQLGPEPIILQRGASQCRTSDSLVYSAVQRGELHARGGLGGKASGPIEMATIPLGQPSWRRVNQSVILLLKY